ncbi:signal peptide peptidase SppA, partial [bacterium]|nr:signal peptide peptidase SppA [bacterium]
MTRESKIVLGLLGLFGLTVIISLWAGAKAHRTERVIWGESAIGVLNLYGPISTSESGGVFDSEGADGLQDQLQAFRDEGQLKALIIRVNSPGGTVGASQELYEAVKSFKADMKIPVVVSIADVGASGAYWVAMAGDTIVANPGSMVGSVGVIMSNLDLSDVPSRYGINMTTLKSGKYKDLLSSWRKMQPEERELLQAMLDDVHAQFIATLIRERKIPTDDAIALAQGQIFSGRQAKAAGLVDELGGFDVAVRIAKEKAKIKGEPELVNKTEPSMRRLIQRYFQSAVQGA